MNQAAARTVKEGPEFWNLYLAKLGDEFSPVGEFGGLTIRVSTITAGEVRLEVTPLGRSVIL